MTPLRLALLSLTRRKTSTLIAFFAIAISVTCAGILLRLYYLSSARFLTLADEGDAVVGAKAGGLEILLGSLNAEGPYPDFIPMNLYESLKSKQQVKFEDGAESKGETIASIIPLLYFGKFKDYRVLATDSSFLSRPREKDSLSFAEGKWAEAPGDVVVGSRVAQREGLHVGNDISIQTWVGDKSFGSISLHIVGILNPKENIWDNLLYSNLAQAQALLGASGAGSRTIWGTGVLHYFLIYLKNDSMESLKTLINRRTVAQIISVPDEKLNLEKLTGTGRKLGSLMVVFIMLLGGLAVSGMLISRFEAMSVQVAIFRAIGYMRREIAQWLLWEGFLLGLAACLVGGIFDALLFPTFRDMLGASLPDATLVATSVFDSYPVWASALLATTLAVFIPLFRFYKQDIHDSLRGS